MNCKQNTQFSHLSSQPTNPSLPRLLSPNRNKSILSYFDASGFHETLKAFKIEACQPDYENDPKAKTTGLLEKKWTSVVRLQKKVSVIALGCAPFVISRREGS